MENNDASWARAFPMEDPQALLQLTGYFLIFHKALPQILSDLENDPAISRTDALGRQISRLSTAAQLMRATPLLPYFDAMGGLVQSITADHAADKGAIVDLLKKISAFLASQCNTWKKNLGQTQTTPPEKLFCLCDESLLTQARSLYGKKHVIDFSDDPDLDARIPEEMVVAYIREGQSFITAMQSDLMRSEQDRTAVEELHQILSMLKGDGEVLADQGGMDTALVQSHPLGQISAMVTRMLQMLDTFLADDSAIPRDTAELFSHCFDELQNLFQCLAEKKPPKDRTDILLNHLNDQYHRQLKQKASVPDAPVPSKSVLEKSAPDSPQETFISIRLERIEILGNLIGELVVAKNGFNNLRILMDQGDKTAINGFLKKTEDSFHRIISDLDNVVMKMRMQKINTLFQRFPRMVRDLSKKMGKDIDLVFAGQDTEIDNRILGAITDPLMHLVRNALDHGVETVAQRQDAGKDEKGLIRLSAKNRNGRINIEIFDNGRGIDPDVLKRKAVEKNLLQPREAQNLSDQEARELIFMPGFSTAEQVTDVSGRGVGMDVVVSNIKEINGLLSIESETGRFTRVMLSLPSSISVSKGLKVCMENDLYLISMDVITKMIFVGQKNVHRTRESVFVETEGAIYPVLNINQMMGYRSPIESGGDIINLVVIKNEQKSACVAVDRIMGIEDIVIKPLPAMYAGLDKWYAGCTILSDGNIVLILNMNRFFEQEKP
jgi:chemotaxis protein histidine kinase CheA